MSEKNKPSDEITETFHDVAKKYAYEIPAGISDSIKKIMTDSAHILNGARDNSADEDIAYYKEIIEEKPNSPFIYLFLASTLEAIGEYEKASEYYEESLALLNSPIECGYILERKAACDLNINSERSLVSTVAAMHSYLTPQNEQ